MDSEAKIEQNAANSQDLEQAALHPDTIDAGEALVSWETWEFPLVERGRRWYLSIVLIGALLIAYGLYTSDPLFSLIILMIGVMLIVNSTRHPKRIAIHITTGGIVIGSKFHPYDELKDFSIIYKPPYSTVLYIDFNAFMSPVRSIELERVDPIAVRDALIPVLPENIEREDELLTDLIKKVYKL